MNELEKIIGRGIEETIEKDSIFKKLRSGSKLRIKHGIDPTGPKIHLGRAIQFRKLRKFQSLGHKIVLIIGDFTAKIGDASDKLMQRKPLNETEIKENMRDYLGQIGKILDLDKVEIHYNSEWHKKEKAEDLIKLAMNFTVQQLIQRRNFKERWEAKKEIGLHEILYPLLQGYDSVAVKSDIEIGGSDQLFNLLAGRTIQEKFNQKPQDIITFKMLTGLDGRKMSTSWGNVVNIADEPNDMYGKLMSMKDEMISEYALLCTDLDLEELEKISNPRDQKAKVAFEIVKLYYLEKIAQDAQKEFEKVFKSGGLPEKMPEIKIDKDKLNLVEFLASNNLVSSKSEARRLIKQGGIEIKIKDKREKIKDIEAIITAKDKMIIKIGKRKFIRLRK